MNKVNQLIVSFVIEADNAKAEVVLYVGGSRVPTGIVAPTSVAAVRLLVDRLAGVAP